MNKLYPVVFFVFKRPSTTIRFLEVMKKAGTRKIYIFADGPRNIAEKFETDAVKKNIDQFIQSNQPIDIDVNYAKSNLGLKRNIVDGLAKVFRAESAAIIVEDDCLPSLDFFRFTNEMLSRYKDEDRVMSVTGTAVGNVSPYSYDFTRYQHCWGWATWARSWQLYDAKLAKFTPNTWLQISKVIWPSPIMRLYWHTMLTMTKAGWLNTWDFQWSYSHFVNHGLAIYPMVNLVSNIGFDAAATNTKMASPVSKIATGKINWPLKHPKHIEENLVLTSLMERKFYYNGIAILGMIRQYVYWTWNKYVNRH